jgi:short-subunit dehydrogenase
MSDSDIERMVSVNSLQPIYLIKVLLNQIKERKGRSAIITTSSIASMRPSPAQAVYSATKAFATYLSVALGHELKDKIDFLAISPGPVSTQMTMN